MEQKGFSYNSDTMRTSRFTWVPFYRELARKLLHYEHDHKALVQILKMSGITVGLEDIDINNNRIELDDIDPFTFFSFINKYKDISKRIQCLSGIKKDLTIQAELPKDFDGVPITFAMHVWFFNYKKERQDSDIPNLWKFFKQIVAGEPGSNLFMDVLNIHGVGKAKLTQGMFVANPDNYFPIDRQTGPYLKKRNINPDFNNLQEYLEIIDKIRSNLQQPFYEISHNAWQETTVISSERGEGDGIKYWLYDPGRNARY